MPQLHRGVIALGIIGAHVAALYAVLTIGPAMSSRLRIEEVSARFIDAPQPRREWQPPVATPINPPIYLQEFLVPEIEVQVEQPPTPAPITGRVITAANAPVRSAGDAPKLISSVEYVREPAPRYPPQSRRLREQGLVVLRVLIDEKGQASSIEIESSSGHVRLDHAAKDAVARAAFRPYVEDGAPRRALVLIPIEFSLSGTV